MGSGDHDTRRGMQITGRKGHGRHRHQNRPDTHLDPIGCKNTSSDFCEHVALDAAVIADCHRRFCKVFLQIVSQSLRRFCYRVNVHAVGARTNHAAQTTRAKGKVTVEGILDFGIVQRFQFGGNIGIYRCISKPSLIFFFDVHLNFPHSMRLLASRAAPMTPAR